MLTLTKNKYEQFPVYANFTNSMERSESISSHTTASINVATGVDSKSEVIVSDSIDGTKIKINLNANTAEAQHKITVKVNTGLGNYFETELYIEVNENTDDYFEKQPYEEFLISNDFKHDLADSETISSKTITAIRTSDSADVTSSVIESSVIAGTKILVGVKAGTSGETYLIQIKIVTSSSNKFQKNIVMLVNEI